MRLLLLSFLMSTLQADSMWQDYQKLQLVCFYKTAATREEALRPVFPAGNRRAVGFEFQRILKQPDISATLQMRIAAGLSLTVTSLLQDDGQDLAIITTRLVREDNMKGFGDNHDTPRNTSGMNYMELDGFPGAKFVSYACGLYDSLPAQPRVVEGARVPPIR